MPVNWSQFQQDIFAHVAASDKPGAINAVAGGAKTTTLTEAARRTTQPTLIVAFNKHIVTELERRLGKSPDRQIRTCHALGLSSIRDVLHKNPVINERKYTDVVNWALDQYPDCWRGLFETQREAQPLVRQLVEFARLSLVNPDDQMFPIAAAAYNLECPPTFIPVVIDALAEGASEASHDGLIDFTDMIWLPNRWDLQVDRYPIVMVDEVQDLNPAQLQLVLRCRAQGARGLVVGDPHQAIMGWAYASMNAYQEARDAIGATELPLSICYRCPTTHLALARQLVPHILARDDAPPGEIHHTFTDGLTALAQPGDMVLCRYTAPLIAQAIRFIRARKPAFVRGRDIGDQMCALIAQVERREPNFALFETALNDLAHEHHDKLTRRNASQSVHNAFDDRIACVSALYQTLSPLSYEQCKGAAKKLCAETGVGVCLSTVHRAKGLEAERVWILEPEALERSNDPQMRNVKYVALTRSKHFLGFVHKG